MPEKDGKEDKGELFLTRFRFTVPIRNMRKYRTGGTGGTSETGESRTRDKYGEERARLEKKVRFAPRKTKKTVFIRENGEMPFERTDQNT